MRKLFLIAACCLLLAPPATGQTPRKDGWGPWRWTDFKVGGMRFRSKCVSNLGTDSKWEYQFLTLMNVDVDFVEREEHGVPGTTRNELGPPQVITLNVGKVSPVFESTVHGTCSEVRELKVEILCVTGVDRDTGLYPCFNDGQAHPIDPKPLPSNPRYE